MSALATAITAWAAIYGYVGIYFVLLHVSRPNDREYLAFGLLAVGLSIYCIGNGVVVDAATLSRAAFGMRITEVGSVLGLACFVDFSHELVGRRSHLPTIAWAWAAIGLPLFATGVFVDPAASAPPASWGFEGAPDYTEAALRIPGRIYFTFGIALSAWAAAWLVPVARSDRDVRALLLGAVPAVLAGAHDMLVRSAGLRSVYLLEHASLLAVLAMGYVLMDRFARASDELRARRTELKQSYEELRKTQRQLVRKEQLAAVGELSAIIAHEVRNPLAVIKNAVSGLRRASLRPEDRKTLVGILDEETDRLGRLVRDLLAYAQPMSPRARPIELEPLVRDVVERLQPDRTDERDIEVRLELDGEVSSVAGDAELLRQALLNVVDNALQAMPRRGTLTVRARATTLRSEPAVELSVEDTGEGMDALVRTKASNPFFTTRPAGTGLGLAIVERVLRNHEGELEIASEHGRGTVIRMVLPAHLPEEREG